MPASQPPGESSASRRSISQGLQLKQQSAWELYPKRVRNPLGPNAKAAGVDRNPLDLAKYAVKV